MRKPADAIPHLEEAAKHDETALVPVAFLMNAYLQVGHGERARTNAELTLARVPRVLAAEPDNAFALGSTAVAYAILNRPDRVREIMSRGHLLDPDNDYMKGTFVSACMILGDREAIIDAWAEALKSRAKAVARTLLAIPVSHAVADDPRFIALVTDAKSLVTGTK
jgi:hypothetical protein